MADHIRWRNLANLLAYVVNLAVTYGSLTGIFGQTNRALSEKYQTLVTPVGWAFSIWGPIFIWEAVFAVAQFVPKLRSSQIVTLMTPWWLAACVFQCCWTVTFAQEWILASFCCMCGILLSLLGGILRTDYKTEGSYKEFWLLRAPFSLHGGWIVAASAVNFCVLVDSYRAAPEVMLACAMISFCAICCIVVLMTFAAPRADAIIGLVASWALLGVRFELVEAENLLRPRFNFYDWPQVDLAAVRITALVLCLVCLLLAVVATLKRVSFTKKSVSDGCQDRALGV